MTSHNALPTVITCYDDALRWIYERIDYERIRPVRTSTHFRLERVERLLSVIDSPQNRIPAVHIAGTKGKGTTAAVLSSILNASHVHHGLFTSPHISQFEERMRVDSVMPNPQQLTALVAELQDRLARADAALVEDGPTYFEVATLLAWMYFDQQQVELVVLETGLGGRLDCTNVCRPVVTIITSIGLDHTHILGDTYELIAAEKAGILKHGVPLLTWVSQPEVIDVVRKKSQQVDCPVYWRDIDIQADVHHLSGQLTQTLNVTSPVRNHTGLTLPLLGHHQAGNAAMAISAADLLSQTDARITPATIAQGVAGTIWPLRFEIFDRSPPVILDAAHNPDSIAAFSATFRENFGRRPPVLIFASSQDKDARTMLHTLSQHFPTIVLTRFCSNPRAYDPAQLQSWLTNIQNTNKACVTSNVQTADNPAAAFRLAQSIASDDGVICGTGSIFLAAELRALLVNA
ncbi:MAG: folylpolyglutamate synthase/dihydrofolate synthase family protein [Planctomycetaceae bacterium]